jgi:3-oxoacyl-[acyl-carrier-protein] synthase III
MRYSKILSTGSYVPPHLWKNQDLASMMDTTDEWIQQRTGIKQRYWVDLESDTCTSDLAVEAANRAIKAAELSKSDIDMLILATLSPDHEFPGTACFLQGKLDMPGIPALDVRQQCSGFLYGLSIADQFIRAGTYQKILLVGAECHSKGLNKTTQGRDVAVLFGDGAGAIVLGSCEGPVDNKQSQVYSTHLHADGRFAKELWVQEPSLSHPGDRISAERILAGNQYPKMNGKVVFQHAVTRMPEVLLEALGANGFSIPDVDLFVFHQANLRINEMVAKELGIPKEKVFNTIDRFGNTTAATIPLGFDEAIKEGILKPGMLVASAAFGSGFTWASAVIRW